MRKRITTITIERERVVEIRWRGRRRESRCGQCGAEVQMLTADEAAAASGAGLRAILGRVANGRLHFTTTSEGLLLVCLNSLAAWQAEGSPNRGLITSEKEVEDEYGTPVE